MSEEKLFFNGINAVSGGYFFKPMTPKELATLAKGEKLNQNVLGELEWYKAHRKPHLGPKAGVDPKKLSQTGWGVIFAYDEDPRIKEALSELLTLRKEQAGDLYKEYEGDQGYHYNIEDIDDPIFDTKARFLAERGADTTGPVDPKKMPYYLLIVGDPEKIPYSFQYQMDVQYAVGRIHFDGPDKLDKYAQYARNVVEAEQGKIVLPRQAAFFGVGNDDDPATQLSAEYLVKGLAEIFKEDRKDWDFPTFLKEQAKKAQLAKLLGGDQTPALLFTASHGMGFPNGHELQTRHQGALLCQDWPGPKQWQGKGTITPDYYFSADDVDDSANLRGLIAFHFACYGAGTPRLNDFPHMELWNEEPIAPHAFVAGLPQRLLSHPKGGALAVIGHVERAWGYSFKSDVSEKSEINTFESTLIQLLEEFPVGAALEFFNERYAELSTELTQKVRDFKTNKIGSEWALSGAWTANNDARSYVIIGDPAVKMPVGSSKTSEVVRPAMTPIDVQTRQRFTSMPESAPSSEQKGILSPEPSPTSKPTATGPGAVDYGIFSDTLDQTRVKLTGAFNTLIEKLSKAVDDVTSVEVSTYVSESMNEVTYDRKIGHFTGKTGLRALTRIEIDGDTKLVFPAKKEDLDPELLKIHAEMVKQAQARHVELIKTLTSAAASVVNVLKGL